jgi:hypothetical protein
MYLCVNPSRPPKEKSHMSQLSVLRDRLHSVPPADTSGSYSEHKRSEEARAAEIQKRFNDWKQGLAAHYAPDLSPAAQDLIFEKAWEDGSDKALQYNHHHPYNQVEYEYAPLAAFAQSLLEL